MKKEELRLVNDLWQLWKDIHMAGQLITNKDFAPKFRQLETEVNRLNITNVGSSLPSDKEVEEWFVLNIDNDSASSAIYKFRLWLHAKSKTV